MEYRLYDQDVKIKQAEVESSLGETVIDELMNIRRKIDRSLVSYTKEEISGLVEQLRHLFQKIDRVPIAVFEEYGFHLEPLTENLRHTIIQFSLALDRLSSTADKEQFYTYLFEAQTYFNRIFPEDVTGMTSTIVRHTRTRPFLIVGSSHKQRSSCDAIDDFYHHTLPAIRDLFQKTEAIWPEQCEHVISEIEELQEVLAKQKQELHSYPFETCDQCTIFYCELGVALTHAYELGSKLLASISIFQSCCQSRTKKARQRREEILYYLTLFQHHYDGLLKKTEQFDFLQKNGCSLAMRG